jgi:hypothetical protein
VVAGLAGITTSGGADQIYGGPGLDQIVGDGATGTGGADQIWGGDGADIIAGDELTGLLPIEGGNDTLNGCDGIDTLLGDAGNDTLDGGPPGFIVILLGDIGNGGDGTDTCTNIEVPLFCEL